MWQRQHRCNICARQFAMQFVLGERHFYYLLATFLLKLQMETPDAKEVLSCANSVTIVQMYF